MKTTVQMNKTHIRRKWGGSPIELRGFTLMEMCNLKVQHIVILSLCAQLFKRLGAFSCGSAVAGGR